MNNNTFQGARLLILDFGSQYTQLIARRVRELNVYCEIHPFNHLPEDIDSFAAVILSGSPYSVLAKHMPLSGSCLIVSLWLIHTWLP